MIIAKVIGKLKGQPNYKWESTYTLRDLFTITAGRGWQLIRGVWKRFFFRNTAGLLFIGKKVTIKHAYLLTAGKNFIIDDNTYINALSFDGIVVKDNVSIARDCTLICTGIVSQKGKGITIGHNTGINCNAYLGGQGGIDIGNDVIIGPGVKVFSENHNYADMNVIIKDQGVSRNKVSIKNNCWIGANATILAGVTIGEGSIIAAGTVLTKSVPANSVVAGIPGRVIKQRLQQQVYEA
ncbi:acyltransferase [Mucilaginibacter glaciei]|uniref:Acyltransferase n=1 Tax=Mucilaginibacter glaciei TaxID=2772109 RepID=A0A926NVD9_9SPHI|nr:acyltransferase [Mucilaginibacter glaciei]MBD1395405.1 acyltransferase [Mucilaginibacter glaciei]